MNKKIVVFLTSAICLLLPASVSASFDRAEVSFVDMNFCVPSEWDIRYEDSFLYLYPKSDDSVPFMYFYDTSESFLIESSDVRDGYFKGVTGTDNLSQPSDIQEMDITNQINGYYITADYSLDGELYSIKNIAFNSPSRLISAAYLADYDTQDEYFDLFDSVLSSISFSADSEPTPTPTMAAPTPTPTEAPDNPIVYVTKTGKKYHREGCPSLSRSKREKRLSEVGSYEPCDKCNPPEK